MEGRVALVTGASRGIGRAIARRLAAEGAAVVLSASRPGAHGDLEGTLDDAVEAIRAAGGQAASIVADLASQDARRGLVARAEETFGPIDVLVNNAAMGRFGPPSEVGARDLQKMLDVNLHAPVDLAQQALPGMRARRRGWILSIGSDSAHQPAPPYRDRREAAHAIVAYGATKAALDRFMQGLAHEVAPDGVFVNVVRPVAIVLTQAAERAAGRIAREHPDLAEPVELTVEAALELVTASHVGRVVDSRSLLHERARPVMSLDGEKVLGDAFLAADLSVVS